MPTIKEIERIETSEIIATLHENGIVHLFIQPHTEVTLDTLGNILIGLKKLKIGPVPLVVEAGEFVTVSKEAKIYAVKFEKEANIESRAVITKNLAQKILVNYYYKNQPFKKPFKEFKSIESGMNWLLDNKITP